MRYLFLALALLVTPAYAANQVDEFDGGRFTSSGVLNNTTDIPVTVAKAGVQYCAVGIQVSSYDTLGADFIVRILSNDTAIWQLIVPAEGGVNGLEGGHNVDFAVPVCAVVGEALEVDVSGDTNDGLLYYNIQGYTRF